MPIVQLVEDLSLLAFGYEDSPTFQNDAILDREFIPVWPIWSDGFWDMFDVFGPPCDDDLCKAVQDVVLSACFSDSLNTFSGEAHKVHSYIKFHGVVVLGT